MALSSLVCCDMSTSSRKSRSLSSVTAAKIISTILSRSFCRNLPTRLQSRIPTRWSVVTNRLPEAVQTARLRVDADLMLFRKSLHTLEGVVNGIGVDQRCRDDVLCSEFLCHLAAEWPRRWFTQPSSRTFATRLSNLDLAATWLSLPLAATRYWSETARDIWNPAVLPANS